MKEYYRAWAEVDLDAVYENISRAKGRIKPGTKIMAIIKADGYGHGAVPIAHILDSIADAYGVAMVEEGAELRESGIKKPILVLGNTPKEQFGELVRYGIMPAVCCCDMAEEISREACRQGRKAAVHLALDTGMGRIGFALTKKSMEEIKRIQKLEGIEIDGCFTHFARADEAGKAFTYQQLAAFIKFTGELMDAGVDLPIRHVSNSAGIIDIPEANLDMVRCGISAYGIYPSDEVDKESLELLPAMSLRARISFLKELDAGAGISYGSTYITTHRTVVATIPVGYGDGYKRALSNCGRVLVHGKPARILGRVCMDQFMVDVTGIEDVKVGDAATLLGRDGEEAISVEELSALSGSFPYEFVCDIGKRMPRVFYFEGKKAGTLDFYHCGDKTYELLLP